MAKDQKNRTAEVRRFKGTTVFDWESEPSIMRPTEFEHSTVPSSLWEASRLDSSTLRQTRRPQRRALSAVVVYLIIAVAVSTAALFGVARLLKTRPDAGAVASKSADPGQ
jgi:hypothetical protein